MITTILYKIIADDLAEIQDEGQNISDNLSNMLINLQDTNVSDEDGTKIQLEGTIEITDSNINKVHIEANSAILKVVENLQTLIVNNISPINDYLSDNKIKVLCTFANMSFLVGFPINIEHIEDVEYCTVLS